MAHNDEDGSSGYGGGLPLRSPQLTYDEADLLYWQRVPVPLHFKLPHGWHLSNSGYAMPPPPPPGAETRARMTPVERALPDNARSGSSGSTAGRQRSSPLPSGAVVVHDGQRLTASAPSRCGAPVKKEVKEEEAASLPRSRLHLHRRPKKVKKEEAAAHAPPPAPEKSWWEIEAEVLAVLGTADDPQEFPGKHIILGRSVNEDYRQVTLNDRQAEVWSAIDHGGNFVDLAGPSEPPAPNEDEEEEEEESFDFSDDDDDRGDSDDADSLDW